MCRYMIIGNMKCDIILYEMGGIGMSSSLLAVGMEMMMMSGIVVLREGVVRGHIERLEIEMWAVMGK